ncbi:group II intron reverse transcriptase/maturase [Vibrio parahaemolyticus]|nr:group II intron reverse transcriptase/maturase [Vibrio parahaemolyticus]EJG1086837.1 group II intron reverse transcriptase/maturase [Vibrio parahaemolyticus]EJS4017184.1 group II intron reverse transcriptase/maturase [Vibrio parahaemolyticus]
MSNLSIPTTPTGDYYQQRNDRPPSFNCELFTQLLRAENLQQAWRQVKTKKGAADIDGMTIEDFPLWLEQGGWRQCKSQLERGEYHPSAVRRVEIDKSDGGKRKLGIPTVIDRVIQQAIAQILTPLFDPSFSAHSFGFRPNRSAKQAVLQVRDIIKQKRVFAVDVDLSKFFDRVNHDFLMTQLRKKVQDKGLLALIGKYLRAGVMVNDQFEASSEGVPQGGPLSPLLSNIMLDSLDKELENRGHQFVRYADDFIILVRSQRAGVRVLKSVTHYLATKLKLVVNERKSQFLGFTFTRGQIQWHAKTVRIFKQKVKRLTNRNWGVSMGYQLFKLRQYLQGWINYFGIANAYQACVELDQWIRRRVRMCYWRQWRKPRTKVQKLLKRGVKVQTAVYCGITSKGPWRSSKTAGIQQALSNEYLKKAGLYSLRDGWIAVHYPNQKVG